MKNVWYAVAAAIAVLVFPVAGRAQSSNELAEIRAQLRGLMQRVEKLEQDNVTLKAENASLREQSASWQVQPAGLIKVAQGSPSADAKTKAPDWTDRVTLKGDLRYRYEFVSDETSNLAGVQATADRYRDRIRARLGLDARVNDEVTLGFQIATGENQDPRSANQTLTGIFARKTFDLDLAFVDWKIASGTNLILGKMKQPFFKPAGSYYFDNDVNPEGLAVTYSRGQLFGSAYGFVVNEISGAENTRTADTTLYGAQVGARLPVGSNNLTVSAMYYDLAAGKGRSPFFAGNPNGNTVINTLAGPVLRNDFRVVDLGAEFTTKFGSYPFTIWADLAQNQGADDNEDAFSAGVQFGKLGSPGTFEFGLGYYSIEADAVFGQVVESDYANGFTDSDGFVLRAGWALKRNVALNATYFLNDRNMDIANAAGETDVDFDRFQFDVNVKF